MAGTDDIAQWLDRQPLNSPIDIDGETVYLNLHRQGAELGAYLMRFHTQEQLREALKQGFSSAISFEAGLGLSPDGTSLVLSQWLPAVGAWNQAAEPLENLLNQLAAWRAALAPPITTRIAQPVDRNERRLRRMFAGAQ